MIDALTTGGILSLAMFFSVIAVLLLGFPVAFTLAGVSLFYAGLGILLDIFNPIFFWYFGLSLYWLYD